jgi:branched-chain amino acid transport system substrate-binding protein
MTNQLSTRRLRLLMLAMGLGSLVLASACGSSNGGSSAAASGGTSGGKCTVVFGTDTEISGPDQVYGAPAAQGLDVAAKAINAAGGVKVGNKKCEFVAANEDNKSDPAYVYTAAQQVVDAHAIATLGPDINDTVAYAAFKSAKVIDFVTGGTVASELQATPGKTPLAVGMIPFQLQEHEAYLRQALASAPSIKTVAIMYPNDEEGQQVDQQFAQSAHVVGLKVVSNVGFPDTATDFSTFLTQVKAAHPDMLIAEQSSQQSTDIMEQGVPLKAAKYYMSETATAQSIEATPGLANTTVFLPTFAPTYSSVETLPTDRPSVIFGHGPAPLVPGAAIVLYYAAWLVKQAVEKAGSLNPQAVLTALIGQSYKGPFGTCTMTSQRYMECQTIFIAVKGKSVTVSAFASPYSAKPIGVYNCVNGVCTQMKS